jgi:mannosyl-oligosaccharide alpha-1,2-mannosidase
MPLVAVLALPTFALPHANPIEKRADNHTLNRERADAVKAAFQHAWNGYKTYAFPHDELHPVSNSFSDSRSASLCSKFGIYRRFAEMAGVQVLLMLSAPLV